MRIRFLGTHNAESRNTRFVSFLIDEVLAVDAGSLALGLTFQEQAKIRAILLSHGHYDHIKEIPAFAFNNYSHPTKVFALPQTLQILSSHLVDGLIYPKFTDGDSFIGKPTLELHSLEPFQHEDIEGYRVLAIPVVHPIPTVGFGITSKDGKSIFYTGDTGPDISSVWEYVSPQRLITDVTFPNRLENIAKDAGHLSPELLKTELSAFKRIKGYLPMVTLIHLSPQFESEIAEETRKIADELGLSIQIASEDEELII